MSDFVEQPIKKIMNPSNPISRIEDVENGTKEQPSSLVQELAELSSSLGDVYAGRFIAPVTGVEDIEPTSTDFSGSFMSGDGETFNSVDYHVGGVSAGVLQFGLSATDGKAYTGGGVVVLGSDGIAITSIGGKGSQNTITWRGDDSTTDIGGLNSYDASGANIQATTTLTSGNRTDVGDSNLILEALSKSGGVGGAISFEVDDTTATKKYVLELDYKSGYGTFTPTITGQTTAGVGTYTTQYGEYFRIGKLVFVSVYLVWTAHTGTGNMRISDLPFVSGSSSSYSLEPFWSNLTLAAVGNKVLARVITGQNYVAIQEIGSAAVANVAVDTAATLGVNGVYYAA